MYYIGEGIELNFLEAKEKFDFISLFNDKRFTVKDTPLTYRQINKMGDDKLFKDKRGTKASWRKFNFKELIYLKISDELKKFGFQNWQIKDLSDHFLNSEYNYLSDLALGCVFGQIEIILTVDNEGWVNVYDYNFYTLLEPKEPHIKITLNHIVNSLITKIGKKPIPIKFSIENTHFDRTLLPKEEELLKIIRNKTYSAITVKKTDGQISIIHAEKTKDRQGNLTETELLKLIKENDFQDIGIIKRDGKIVSYKIEETIKL